MVRYVPEQGDIVWLNFEPQKGNEIKKTRPALVISSKKYNAKTNLAIFMPITSQIKNYPFELEVSINGKVGAVLCDQVRSLDWKERKASKITTLSEGLLEEAVSKLNLLIS
ncbi:type II toxin-antitoxin system PemK/MazF family toxin [Rickettsiaceae bacterium]|nr:type II toxin-antitoxin system PemK/MazF family toxin [Rickettsiaceae bacterium]